MPRVHLGSAPHRSFLGGLGAAAVAPSERGMRDGTLRAEAHMNAAGEDRTPDLRIMRPTRCQLRYCRHGMFIPVLYTHTLHRNL